MSTKIGSLLIEVASGVARVESDMKKITKVINSNAEMWTKAFGLVKIAAASWLAKETFQGAIRLMGEFASAGLEGAERLKAHADAAAEFKQRQAELNVELQKFAGEIIGPMLPMVNNSLISMKAFAEASQSGARQLADLIRQMPSIPKWAPFIGQAAEAWRQASTQVSQYADQVRLLERMRKESANKAKTDKSSIFSTDEIEKASDSADDRRVTSTRNLMNVLGKIEQERPEKVRKALEEQRRTQQEYDRLFAEDERIAKQVRDEQELEWTRQGQEQSEIKRQRDAEISAVYNANRAQTLQGQLELLEEHYRNELSLTEWNATQKLAIEKRYTKAVNDIQRQRKDISLSVSASMYGALGQAASVFFGQQSAAAKAFGVLEVIVNTQRAVMQAWAAYPPPFGKFMAAAAYIQGAASIASILKAGSGGSSVGSASGGGTSMGNPSSQGSIPEAPVAAAEPEEKRREAGKTTIIINNMIGERTWVTNNLVPLLEESQRDRGWNVEMQS